MQLSSGFRNLVGGGEDTLFLFLDLFYKTKGEIGSLPPGSLLETTEHALVIF